MSLKNWSTTAASNATVDSINFAEGQAPSSLNDSARALMADVRAGLYTKGSDIASASTADLAAATTEGLFHDITGTTTITSLGTVGAGVWKVIKFEGALTLTHNATSLILPGAANITTADGDVAIFVSEGSGNWRCVSYAGQNANHLALTGPVIATQAQQESGSSVINVVTPGRQQYHPSAAKVWCLFNTVTSTTNLASYNVTSLTDGGTGVTTINYTTSFSSANYAGVATCASYNAEGDNATVNSYGTGSAVVRTTNGSQFTNSDNTLVSFVAFGDQ